ncbi:MAG: hypothetical protein V4467_01250 [Patescibacteria group bacterium]
MFTKGKLKEETIALRRKGLSYSEILKQIPVAKSTISLWLRDVGLAKKQKQVITEKRIAGRLRGVDAVRRNKIRRVKDIKDSARQEVASLIRDPFWLTGVILYWAEGSKEHAIACPVKFTNMDLQAHKIFLNWIHQYLQVVDGDTRFELFIHEKADVESAKKYWKQNLKFREDKLKVYFKKHNPKTKRRRVGEDYRGVLSVIVSRSISLNRKIAGWVEGVVVYLSSRD